MPPPRRHGPGSTANDAGGREAGGKAAALTRRGGDLEDGLVAVEGVLDDGEAEAGAAGFTGTAAIDPIEAFGQARDVLRLDADARVLNRENTAVFIGMPVNGDVSASRRVTNGVETRLEKALVSSDSEPMMSFGSSASTTT